MATILAVVTEDARKYWPWFLGGYGAPSTTTAPLPGPAYGTWNPQLFSFKVGEGGWIDPGTGAERRTPVNNLRCVSGPLNGLQDIDAIVDPTRAAIDQRYTATTGWSWFEKAFVSTDFTYVSPSILEVRCFLDFGDFNLDTPGGNPPEIWEIGLFSDHPLYARDPVGTVGAKRLMVAYGTIPKEIKDATKQILHTVRIVF